MSELSTRLLSEAEHHRTLWRANFAVAAILFLAALACSALATVFAATNTYHSLLPWLTAAPGAIILANSYFKFGDRYAWHFEKSTRLMQISRQVEFGSVPEKEAVDWWNTVDSEINEKAPTFGEFTVYPGSARPKAKGRNQKSSSK
jgi:hypothetical protein